ncbi:MAG TPA: tetratricopeptide repeat protein [Candidatus Solibacter sp.]|nr:tetratricopeptide repeat protein [Candidatus Solibacter sp.]
MARRKQSSPPNAPPSPPAISRPAWIYNPWLDLTIGCGGWSAPLLLVALLASRSQTQQWALAFYFLALLFNYPHFMATVYRAYHTREQFEKYRIFTVHVALLLALAGVLAHALPAFLPWLFTLYICWSPWHYTGQNFGLMMMFARRGGLEPERRERRALYAAFIASYVLLMISFHTGPSSDEMILSLGIPARWALWPKAACAVFFLGACAWVLARFVRRAPDWRAWAGPVTLVASQFLWFVLPVSLEFTSGLQVPQARYSSGILAVLHSTQYIWITSYYQRREARAQGRTDWRLASYAITLVAGGIALFIPGPWIVSRLLHADFGSSFLTFTALVNIHHFILDGALWKLRDSRVSALLIDSGEKPAEAPATAGDVRGRAIHAARWLAGDSTGARVSRVAAALLLCAWGLMDQARFYWTSAEGRLPELERAARLVPYDSGLLARIARANQKAEDQAAAVVALTRATALRPHSRGLQESLAQALVSAGRYPEAYQRYQELLAQYPNDVAALVNAGVLAQRLGKPDEAVDRWNRAVDLDPSQGNAQLYLGDALAARGEEQAAARHYRAYLKLTTDHPELHPGESHLQLGAIIKVADAWAHTRHPAEAAIGYDAAIPLAQKDHDVAMESIALIHHAELEESQGRITRAAQFFQRGLAVDAGYNDAPSVSADWAEYGQFLRRHGQPERFSFACFLHAEELLQGTPGPERDTISKLRAESEARLGAAAAGVRKQKDAVLAESATIPAAAFSR